MEYLAYSLDRIATTHSLREQAETEPLTGLGNRRRLQRALDQQLSRAKRYGERVALLLLDLDRFKAVNDELGHETGDAVIVACAEALRERTRGYDELVRLGGDEFVVVAPVPDVLDAHRLADEIRDQIAVRCNALLPPDWGSPPRSAWRCSPTRPSIPSRCCGPPTSRSTGRRPRGQRRCGRGRARRGRHHGAGGEAAAGSDPPGLNSCSR